MRCRAIIRGARCAAAPRGACRGSVLRFSQSVMIESAPRIVAGKLEVGDDARGSQGIGTSPVSSAWSQGRSGAPLGDAQGGRRFPAAAPLLAPQPGSSTKSGSWSGRGERPARTRAARRALSFPFAAIDGSPAPQRSVFVVGWTRGERDVPPRPGGFSSPPGSTGSLLRPEPDREQQEHNDSQRAHGPKSLPGPHIRGHFPEATGRTSGTVHRTRGGYTSACRRPPEAAPPPPARLPIPST